ncbi:hypothetical protein D3C76_1223700 [compost metagenome]
MFQLFVGGGQYPRIAGGQANLDPFQASVGTEGLDLGDHPANGGGLVVGQVQVHRRHAAVLVQVTAHPRHVHPKGAVVFRVHRHGVHRRVTLVVTLVIGAQLAGER